MLREIAGAGGGCAPTEEAAGAAGPGTNAQGSASSANPIARLADVILGGRAKLTEQSGAGFDRQKSQNVDNRHELHLQQHHGQQQPLARLTPWQLRQQVISQRDFESAWEDGQQQQQQQQEQQQQLQIQHNQRHLPQEIDPVLQGRQQRLQRLNGTFHSYFASAFQNNLTSIGELSNREADVSMALDAVRMSITNRAGHHNLSVEDVARVRNRMSVIGRHVYAHLGHEAADTVTSALLEAMQMEPIIKRPLQIRGSDFAAQAAADSLALGQRGHRNNQSFLTPFQLQQQNEWIAEFEGGAAQHRASLGRQIGIENQGLEWVNNWQNFEAGISNRPEERGAMWAKELAAPQIEEINFNQTMSQNVGNDWASDFAGEGTPSQDWVNDFESMNRFDSAAVEDANATNESLRRNTAAVAEVLSKSDDPKMRQSQFLQFMSKMSRGEISIEGDRLVGDNGSESLEATRVGSTWADEFQTYQSSQEENGITWAESFSREQGITPQSWIEDFENFHLGPSGAVHDSDVSPIQNSKTTNGESYVFDPNNKYLGTADALEIANNLFKSGSLSEAVLAMEAAVQANPNNSSHWRLLGMFHAENDDDARAIIAMTTAHSVDPKNLEVLLSLGVSHTNELDRDEALGYLVQWLANHPKHAHLLPRNLAIADVMNYDEIIDVFKRATREANASTDPDIFVVLGVLYHLSRDFESSLESFNMALNLRPGDYSLLNKIGVTLANGSRSNEALGMYKRALSIKPNYVRAWSNLGIGYANTGDFLTAASVYVHALNMNSNASSVWNYLRMAVACAERPDLLDAVEAKDLSYLTKALPLVESLSQY